MSIASVLSIVAPALVIALAAYIHLRTCKNLWSRIGELEYRLRAGDEEDRAGQLERKELQLKVAEQDSLIQEQQLSILERKEDMRSLRAVLNRNEVRISVYEANEVSFQQELTQLQNKVLVEQAKQRFLERENNELRQEVIKLRDSSAPSQLATPAL